MHRVFTRSFIMMGGSSLKSWLSMKACMVCWGKLEFIIGDRRPSNSDNERDGHHKRYSCVTLAL